MLTSKINTLWMLLMAHWLPRIVAYHGSAVGAAQFWLRPGAVVLEFMPCGCWCFSSQRSSRVFNVGIAIINQPFLMVYTFIPPIYGD